MNLDLVPIKKQKERNLRETIDSIIDEVVDLGWHKNDNFRALIKETAAHEALYGKLSPKNPMQVDDITYRNFEQEPKILPLFKALGAKIENGKLDRNDLKTNIITAAMKYSWNDKISEGPKNFKASPLQEERASQWKEIYNTLEGKGTEKKFLKSLEAFDMREKPQGKSFIEDFFIPSAEAAESKLDLKPIKKNNLDLKPINSKLDLKPVKPKLELEKNKKQETKKENSNIFMKTLDFIGRPGYAVKSLLKQVQLENFEIINSIEKTGDPIEDQKNIIKALGERKPEVKKRFEALWKGFSGQEKVAISELREKAGFDAGGFGNFIIDFMGEIGTDPLMAAGGAGYKAINKGIGKVVKPTLKISSKAIASGIKQLERIPKIGKAITTARETLPSMAEGLKKAFVTKSGIKGLTDLIDKHLLKREYLKGKELRYGIKVRNVIQNISKKTKRSIDDIESQIVNYIEQPHVYADAPNEIKALGNTLKTHFENLLTSEMKAGVPITRLAKNAKNIEYFPRITTKEAKQYLKQAKVGNKKIWNTKLSNSLRRKTGDFSLSEFNDFVKANGLESLGGRQVEQFFMRNPAYATATRGVRSAKAVTSAEFLKSVGEKFGMNVDDATKRGYSFYQKLPDTITKLNPSLKNKVFEPEVYDEITRIVPKYFNPNELNVFSKVFDSIQNTWKRWTLAPFPKYHIRNMVGNTWNNYLANVAPKNYIKAQALQTYGKYKNASSGVKANLKNTAIKELKSFGISIDKADDIIKQAEQTGVLGKGWFGGDIESAIEKTMNQGFKNLPLNTKIKKVITGEIGIEKGMAFGSTIENNARLAHFIDRIDKAGMLKQGITLTDNIALSSAQSVKKFLFDYGDLTYFEKQIAKRFLPFYTWTRKNIPLQFEQLVKQPQKFAKLAIPLRARNTEDLVKLKYSRPDLYERLPIELRRDADTVTYVPLEGLIPAGDLAKIIRPDELLFEMITPYLKAPLELKFNKSLYFESELQRYDRETQELLKKDIPVKIKYLATTVLPQARLLNEINKIVKKQVRKEELTPLEQAFSQALSSIYKVNLKDLKLRAKLNIKKKIDDLLSGAKWAKRRGREEEYRRIKNTIKDTMEIFRGIK